MGSPEPSITPSSRPSLPTSIAPSRKSSVIPTDGSIECGANQVRFELLLSTDQYPAETEWELKSVHSGFTRNGGPYDLPRSEYSEAFCIAEDAYVFTLKDSYGDGLCCNYGRGAYSVVVDGVVVKSGGQFQSREKTDIMTECDAGDSRALVQIDTDYFGKETSWAIETAAGVELLSGSGYGSWDSEKDSKCLDTLDCYKFIIRDACKYKYAVKV